ncbi:MAG: acyclic terpene utilization AtuA family protein [Chloroflexota bacterium]
MKERQAMKTVRLGAGSAYWGDALEPAVELARQGNLDYIGFDHLAELTLSIFQRIKAKDPDKGYIPDLLPWMEAILPWTSRSGTKVVSNAGAANPLVGAREVAMVARRLGLAGLKIAAVTGDDVLEQIDRQIAAGFHFRNLDTGSEDIASVRPRIVAANAYIGSEGIVEALERGADVVVTGRVSDNALYVGPMMHEFGWTFRDGCWSQLGAAVTIGHLLECAALATGAISNFWESAPDLWRVGYPIAEVTCELGGPATSGGGSYGVPAAVLTKVPGSGGMVTPWTIKEQLVYEVHDPRSYLMPDAIADFTTLRLDELGPDRVRVSNMSGRERPSTLKLCIGYEDGWIGEGIAMFAWPEALKKARRAEELVRRRLEMLEVPVEELLFEYGGYNALHLDVAPAPPPDINEIVLRVAGRTRTREAADVLRREVTHLWTLGGVGSAVSAPSRPRPVVSLWPTLFPREAVRQHVEMIEA